MPVSMAVALKALGRNRLQTGLTMLGMTIGVAAVLAMIALGTGAEAAIDEQVRAAGMNLIVVTAGNYKGKTEDDFGGGIDHQGGVTAPPFGFREAGLGVVVTEEGLGVFFSPFPFPLPPLGERAPILPAPVH